MTLDQIAGLMNVTCERVRQLKDRALGALRTLECYEQSGACG